MPSVPPPDSFSLGLLLSQLLAVLLAARACGVPWRVAAGKE